MTIETFSPKPKSFEGYAAEPPAAATSTTRVSRPTTTVTSDARPDEVAALRRHGAQPHQVLMFGEGALTGIGLRDHNLGLPGHVADSLAAWSGRGVDLDVFGDADPTSSAAVARLRALRLQRYDAILVVLGVTRASRYRAHKWEAEIAALAGVLAAEGADSAALFIVDSSRAVRPLSGPTRWLPWGLGASHLAPIVETVCSRTCRVRCVELDVVGADVSEGGRFSDETYSGWADQLVACMQPALVAATKRVFLESAAAYRSRPDAEAPRRGALKMLCIDRVRRDEFLDGVVRQVKRMYDVDAAAVHFLDGELLWSGATTNAQGYAVPQSGALCESTIQGYGLLLVNDVGGDSRFQQGQADGIPGFYAGYPIRTWDGYRIGTICIMAGEPRSMRRDDLTGLRDFAGRIEQYLWRSALRD